MHLKPHSFYRHRKCASSIVRFIVIPRTFPASFFFLSCSTFFSDFGLLWPCFTRIEIELACISWNNFHFIPNWYKCCSSLVHFSNERRKIFQTELLLDCVCMEIFHVRRCQRYRFVAIFIIVGRLSLLSFSCRILTSKQIFHHNYLVYPKRNFNFMLWMLQATAPMHRMKNRVISNVNLKNGRTPVLRHRQTRPDIEIKIKYKIKYMRLLLHSRDCLAVKICDTPFVVREYFISMFMWLICER